MRPRSRSSNLSTSRVLLASVVFGLAELAQAQTSQPSGHDALLLTCQQSLPCKSHLDRATELNKQELHSMAVEEYEAAYSLQPYPPILYNIARLHHKQNHLAEAVAYYQRYLDSSHPERVERAKQFLSEAQQGLATEQSKPAPPPLMPAAPSALSTPVAPAARPALVTPAAPAALCQPAHLQ